MHRVKPKAGGYHPPKTGRSASGKKLRTKKIVSEVASARRPRSPFRSAASVASRLEPGNPALRAHTYGQKKKAADNTVFASGVYSAF